MNDLLIQQAEELVVKLSQRNLVISLAESCTGGMVSSYITAISGASKIFDRGFVTYSNLSKSEEIFVSEEILDEYGAVSKEVANEMSLGVLRKSSANIACSITGIAGPNSDTSNKPVGLVYISVVASKNSPIVMEYNFKGNRNEVREKTVAAALILIKNYMVRFF